ncbi:MAG: hypothetical protein CMB64_01845 [Euryarchaeota archaeon]|nr:hypothetical protein [Euryarchaeota archaeon]|tara:strand:- start:1816 stop:2358 length:543 start_codon:yes stop_codon:yes gene_type:complete
MSEAADEGMANFLVPSERISGWLFILSFWGVLLWILNILQMATPTGDKVVWASILSIGLVGGDYLTTNTDFRLYSDGIFIILCASANLLSIRGIMANVDGGMTGWLMNVRDNFWPALVEFANLRKLISVWLIIIGILFYVITGVLYGGWVDPGVYSVAAPCVIFGWAFGKLADVQSLESS